MFLLIETFARSNFNPKNLPSRHPRESGDPCKRLIKMDSHFRGNDGFWYFCFILSYISFHAKLSNQNHRIETMNSSAWQRAKKLAGSGDLHVHDLRHTVGMRLREAEVREETVADILWHNRPSMTAHYSVAQVAELYEALNRISNESNRVNRSLVMIAREARQVKVPQKSPDNKKGLEAVCI